MSIQRDLIQAFNRASEKKVKGYDTQATVLRVEADTVWVHIPGGVDETPIRKTIAARAGDLINVRVAGGRAWITGNESAPPTDDATAIYASYVAETADSNANTANKNAGEAKDTAEAAQNEAEGASSAAGTLRDEYEEYKEGMEDELGSMQEDIDSVREDMAGQIESVISAFAEQFSNIDAENNEIRTLVNTVDGTYADAFDQLYDYIRFITDGAFRGVELGPVPGEGESRIMLRVGTVNIDGVDTNCISFSKDGENLGWWDGTDLYTGNVIVKLTQRAQFGNFAFVPRSNGSLSFLKVV